MPVLDIDPCHWKGYIYFAGYKMDKVHRLRQNSFNFKTKWTDDGGFKLCQCFLNPDLRWSAYTCATFPSYLIKNF